MERPYTGRALNFATAIAFTLIGLAAWYSYALSDSTWCQQLQVTETVIDNLESDEVGSGPSMHNHNTITNLCAGILVKQLDHMGWANLAIIGALALSILGIYFIKIAGGAARVSRNSDGSFSAEMGSDDDGPVELPEPRFGGRDNE